MDSVWIVIGLAALIGLLAVAVRQVRRDGYGSQPPPLSHPAGRLRDATRGTPYF
ncbi:hypothetical protein [Cellulomonas chengniuliangii]|uniref:Uncharacterized protein n=1 Tax=Cellulomonas chengniuliangii TaxID=2968084 RepID=A0ABY5KVI4_9CELL|nr:hypothetical protein [Cellulomonas chengniuliangii]MCC2308805.1 hypothetical protein [Cellulomonas chengniuliangii]UUI74449.1 hypothetical protein NP064_11650 [Cellulomonas chengniuliangii]